MAQKKIFVSEFGEVRDGDIMNKTPKGWRAMMTGFHSRYERVVLEVCPHGNYRSFLDKDKAVVHALEWLQNKEDGALEILEDVRRKRAALRPE